MQIAVIGRGDCSGEEYRTAETVGRLIAGSSATVCCGGLGGVMEAACRGAQEAGGTTVGILPDTGDGNAYLDLIVRTGMGHARNVILINSADALGDRRCAQDGKAGLWSPHLGDRGGEGLRRPRGGSQPRSPRRTPVSSVS